MFTVIVMLHLIAALVLILVVLLQSGKAGDLATTFGGAGSQAAFGARGAATFLTKATAVCAVIFMLTSLALSIMYTEGTGGTVMEGVPYPEDSSSTSPALNPSVQEGATEEAGETQEQPQSQPETPPDDQ
ncbi:MAG: preprotein translocase subunit SecG [Acidobacteriota bacterium]